MRAAALVVALAGACAPAPPTTETAGTAAPVPAVVVAPSSQLASSQTTAPTVPPAVASSASSSDRWLEPRLDRWRFPRSAAGSIEVVVSIPRRRPGQRFPVLIALHGQGEAFRGPTRGALGWWKDYALERAVRRLGAPPLTQTDFSGLTPRPRLERFNESLAARPFQGLVVVMPYTPDILQGEKKMAAAAPFARFVAETLLPKIESLGEAGSAVGIDGVSLGGRVALFTGTALPERFAVVAAMQPAIYPHELPRWERRLERAVRQNPALAIRLLTSTGDFYRGTVERLSRALTRRALKHHFTVADGPHNYAFNRGPGVFEMLVFHDRVLRGARTFE
ncbi:MAG: alpha/beta hydrolase-fold protein [Myxococcota bacterium]